jgi:hypothetical protein
LVKCPIRRSWIASARPALRRRYCRTAAALIRRHQPEQRAGLAVIVVADTVVIAIGIAEDIRWRFF